MVDAGYQAFLELGLPGDRYYCDAFVKASD